MLLFIVFSKIYMVFEIIVVVWKSFSLGSWVESRISREVRGGGGVFSSRVG